MVLYDQVFNVKAFGAKGDAVTNDAGAFQAALIAAKCDLAATTPLRPAKTLVWVPPGQYLFQDVGGNPATLIFPEGVTLQGSFGGRMSHGFDSSPQPPTEDGTTFIIDTGKDQAGGTPFIQLKNDCTVRGISFFWPRQQTSMSPPLSYPFALAKDRLAGSAVNVTIENIELRNAYQGIDATNMPRHLIRNVVGQAFFMGIVVDAVGDVGRLENVHFAPLWSNYTEPVAPVATWQLDNGTAYKFLRTDGQMVTNCFAIYYNIGVLLTAATYPPPNVPWIQFQGLSLDTCRTAIRIEAAETYAGAQFTNCLISAEINSKTDPNGAGVVVTNTFTSHLRFVGCAFRGYSPAVWLQTGTTGSVDLSACAFYDTLYSGRPYSVTAEAGSIVVSGCQFLKTSKHVSLTGSVSKGIVLGNLFPNGSPEIRNTVGATLAYNV
jgi:hypothetical protein